MPNQFQVGDRIRCTRQADAGPQYGVVGRIYTVNFVSTSGFGVGVQELEVPSVKAERFELVTREVPIPDRNPVTFYTLVYKTRFASRRIMGFETEEEFNEKKRSVLANGGTVFAEKKLKLTNVGAQ